MRNENSTEKARRVRGPRGGMRGGRPGDIDMKIIKRLFGYLRRDYPVALILIAMSVVGILVKYL